MSQTQVPPSKRPARNKDLTAAAAAPEEKRRILLTTGLWIVGILLFVAYMYRKFFTGDLTDADAMDFAQIARNIVEGHGYATSIVRPLALSGFVAPDASGTIPDISRPPLYPLVLMLAFLLHGRHGGDRIVIDVSLILFFLSVYGVYRLGRTLYPQPSQIWIALMSMGLYALSGEALGFALSGLPVTLATLLVTALLIALYRSGDTPKRAATFRGTVWVGVLLALCYLTQYSLLLLALPVLLYVFFSRAPARAWAGVGGCVLGFIIIAGPWLYRNAVLCHGDPIFTLLFYGIMADSPDYPGFTTIYRSVKPDSGPLVYFYMHFAAVTARDGRGLAFYRDNLFQCFNFFLLAAATVSLLWKSPDSRLNGLRACVATALALIVVITSFFQPTAEMIAPFVGIITVVAVGYVFTLLNQQTWDPVLQRFAIWGLGLVVGLTGIVQGYAAVAPGPDVATQGMKALSNANLGPKDAVITGSASEVAWHIGLPAVWLPANNEAYQAVTAACAPSKVSVSAILLTPNIARFDISDGEALPWALLLRDPTAFTDHKVLDERWAGYEQKAQANDPSIRPDLIKTGYTPQELAVAAVQIKAKIDGEFVGDFGSISDIMSEFDPKTPAAETADQNSVLFLRRAGKG